MAEFQAAGKERRLFRTAGILFIIIAASTIVLRLLTDILLYNYGAGTLAQLTGGTLGFTALLYIFYDIADAALFVVLAVMLFLGKEKPAGAILAVIAGMSFIENLLTEFSKIGSGISFNVSWLLSSMGWINTLTLTVLVVLLLFGVFRRASKPVGIAVGLLMLVSAGGTFLSAVISSLRTLSSTSSPVIAIIMAQTILFSVIGVLTSLAKALISFGRALKEE